MHANDDRFMEIYNRAKIESGGLQNHKQRWYRHGTVKVIRK